MHDCIIIIIIIYLPKVTMSNTEKDSMAGQ